MIDINAVVISDTLVDVRWQTDLKSADLKWCVQYAEVGPEIDNLSWRQVIAGIGTTNAVRLHNLNPNSEYVYRVRAVGTDSSIIGSSSFDGFVTKLTDSIVNITNIEDGEVLSGTVTVNVEAYDPVARFTDNGIISAELKVDGVVVGVLTRVPETNEYQCSLDTASLTPGFHRLIACVQDDYWHRSKQSINIVVMHYGQSFSQQNSIGIFGGGLGEKEKRKLLRHSGLTRDGQLPKTDKLALILVGDDSRWGWMFYKCARNEKERYEAKGYKVVIITADDVTNIAKFIVSGMYEKNLKAFTYYGHGDKGDRNLPKHQRTRGALYIREPDIAMTSGDLAYELCEYLKDNRNVCPAQLDYMRLVSCWSGCAQWDINASLYRLPAQFTFRQAFDLNPESSPWVKTKIKPPKKMWVTTNKVYFFPGLNLPLDDENKYGGGGGCCW